MCGSFKGLTTTKPSSNQIVCTSIKLDKKIHKLAKIYAIKHNMQLSEVIGFAIMTYIQVDRRC